MPQQRSRNLSLRRRTGIVGTDTRQRAFLDSTPLSLHLFHESPVGLDRLLCPSTEPDTNWRHAECKSQHLSLEWDGMRVRMCF